MKDKIDYTGAKVIVMDSGDNIILNKPLLKLPLSEKFYEIESKKIFGKPSPCILERRRIEYNICNFSAAKLDSGKKYRAVEVGWFMELYNLKGDSIIVQY